VTAPPRTLAQRVADTRHRLDHDVDAWVATAGGDAPHLVPLSFHWDGTTLLVATPLASPTGRNLRPGARVRLGIGLTRDVVLVDGVVAEVTAATAVPDGVGDAFAARTGFDPRTLATPYGYFRIRPDRVQAWREANELAGRDVLRDGRWLGG
jgi:hypothetical protein